MKAQALGEVVDFDHRDKPDVQAAILAKFGGIEGIVSALGVNVQTGLSSTDAHDLEERKNAYGSNAVPPPPPPSFLGLVWDALKDTVLRILLVGAVVTLVVGLVQDPASGWHEGVSIVVTVGIVVCCGCGNDYWKEKRFQALLAKASKKKCKALRNGERAAIWFQEVVVGDLVCLEQGDEVPADGLLLQNSESIEPTTIVIDESVLTGESHPCKKSSHNPTLFAGTLVVGGSATMIVTAVGANTTGGKIAELLAESAKRTTPLQHKLEVLAVRVSKIASVVAIATWICLLGWWLKDVAEHGWQDNDWTADGTDKRSSLHQLVHDFVIAITLVVVAVPDGLPLATTLALVSSMMKLMRRNNFVRNLKASETMGQVTAICSDKTGTLTENKMKVTTVWANRVSFNLAVDSAALMELPSEWRELAQHSVTLNSTVLMTTDASGNITAVGSKTEAALLSLATKFGLAPPLSPEKPTPSKLKVIPFTSDRKRMTTVVACPETASTSQNAQVQVLVKGAPEVVLPLCSRKVDPHTLEVIDLSESERTETAATIKIMAMQGLRTLIAAYKHLSSADFGADASVEAMESDLTLLCIFGIEDPVRREVPEAIKICQRAGITVRMVTGDNKNTAVKIAQDCGIWEESCVVLEGPEFRQMDHQKRLQLLPRLRVLARSSPQDKFILVKSLQELGDVVAVTGDGTNDAPALKEADIGFAMGIQGTDVAKNASDIVLLDDRFDSILQALLWGRNVYASVCKFLQFQFAINLTSCLLTLINAASNNGTPLNSVMLLWINLIMDTLGALAIATEYADQRLLTHPPKKRSDSVLTRGMIFFVLTQSAWQLTVLLWILHYGYRLLDVDDDDTVKINTVMFNVNIMMQLVNETIARHLEFTPNLFQGITKNRFFIPVLCIIFLVQLLLVQFGSDFVETSPLSLKQWTICVVIALLGLPMGWVSQLIHFHRAPEIPRSMPFNSKIASLELETLDA